MHSFNSSLVDQLRYSFQESKVYFEGGAYPSCVATDFGACPAQVHFSGTNNDSDFGGDYDFPQGRTVKVTQVQDNATWTRGKQTLLFGGEFDYQNSPNAGIFYYNGYPTYSTHSNLLGPTPSPELVEELSNEKHVTADTPPCFIWHTWEDKTVKVVNALDFASALLAKGVPFELHIYEKGGHGLGLGKGLSPDQHHRWTNDLLAWLGERGWLSRPKLPSDK